MYLYVNKIILIFNKDCAFIFLLLQYTILYLLLPPHILLSFLALTSSSVQ